MLEPTSVVEARKPGRQRRQHYSELERITGLMAYSVLGVHQASRELQIPVRTLSNWARDIGGPAQLQAEAGKLLGHSMYSTAMKACLELGKRLNKMEPAELIDAIKALSIGAVTPQLVQGNTQAAAPANMLQIVIGEGKDAEVIEAPRPNPDPKSTQ